MQKIKNLNLSWNDRFPILEHYDLTDQEICQFFDVTLVELEAARTLREQNNYFQPTSIDPLMFKDYVKLFRAGEDPAPVLKKKKVAPKKEATPTAKKKATPKAKKATGDGKRGRKTHKIKDAYEAIPYEKVPVEEFMEKHNVSLSVLRRHSHFDHIPEKGKVRVRKSELVKGEEKVLCIWRESPEQ